MSRFQLDPREAAPPPAAPPPPRPKAAPPPPPPARTPPASPQTARRRRTIVIAAVAIAILLVAGGVAVFVATKLAYPDKYVLRPSEYPPGMARARLTASELDQVGLETNPGEIDPARLDDFETNDGEPPERGYGQVMSESGGGRVAILALKYSDDDAAGSAASRLAMLCGFAGGGLLRERDVLVVLLPDDGADRSDVRAIAGALKDKNGSLVSVCGA